MGGDVVPQPEVEPEAVCLACRCFRADVDCADGERERAVFLKYWGLHLRCHQFPFPADELRWIA